MPTLAPLRGPLLSSPLLSSPAWSSPLLSRTSLRLLLALAVPLILAACGDLPEPFLGNPGAAAQRLAVPMTPMLAVTPSSDALLSPRADEDFADLLALSLQKAEIPSLARKPHKTDWRLAVSAGRRGDQVVPHYAILDPSGHEQGAIDGAPFPADSWTAGAPWTLGEAAQDAVPKVLALMMSVRATRDRADPNSLLNRVAKLYVPEVTGAPGDGNVALTRLIRADLAELGPLVQVTPEGTDFTVKGQVTVSPLPKGQQQVEIAWTVTRPSGKVEGKVSQLHSLEAGSLDQYWGDVAGVVAQEASGGINVVVERFIHEPIAPQAATSHAGTPQAAASPTGTPQAAVGPNGGTIGTRGPVANGSPNGVPNGVIVGSGGTASGKSTASGGGTPSGKGTTPSSTTFGETTAPSKSAISKRKISSAKGDTAAKVTVPSKQKVQDRPAAKDAN
jgi:hypothetical protein